MTLERSLGSGMANRFCLSCHLSIGSDCLEICWGKVSEDSSEVLGTQFLAQLVTSALGTTAIALDVLTFSKSQFLPQSTGDKKNSSLSPTWLLWSSNGVGWENAMKVQHDTKLLLEIYLSEARCNICVSLHECLPMCVYILPGKKREIYVNVFQKNWV